MRRRHVAGLILASALITLDGTAATVALPAIGRDLSAAVARLQWITNAPLLTMAALLLPAGTLADRYGRVRLMRAGLLIFSLASIVSAAAPSAAVLIAARLALGVGAALVLPGALAVLRGAYTDPPERARVLGLWAAWTGAAAVAGPLMAGAMVDLLSWRAVFLPAGFGALAAAALLVAEGPAASPTRTHPVPALAIVGQVVLLGGLAFLLMQASGGAAAGTRLWLAVALTASGALLVARAPHRDALLPRELMSSHNCLPANTATFALYFGMFGLSFLVVLYVQQLLDYSASWAAVVLLPMSMMLLFAERFGRLAPAIGARTLITAGVIVAAAGISWMASRAHPLPFWSHIIAGVAVFGLGLSLTIGALTHAAVAAVPEASAGAASGLNHAVVRVAGLFAIAILGSIAAPGFSETVSADGVQRAMIVCAAVVAAGGLAGSAWLRDDRPGGINADA
jgi:MFS family permease